ncbi:MAG TPA: S8 family peptidase [Acidimicrobiia bacterium]|nr:S8 family peptidase [Acidimicrobiia bacterium]
MRRRLVTSLAVLTTALATAIPVGAGQPVDVVAQTAETEAPYVVVMETEPVLGNEELAPEGAKAPDAASSAVEEYSTQLETEKVEVLESAGIDPGALVASFAFAINGFSASLTPAQAESLAAQKGVLLVQRDELRQLHTSQSPEFLGLDDRRGAWDSGFTGAGVVVGVIDSGIWPEHPSFAARPDLGPPPITLANIPDLNPDPAVTVPSTGCDFGNSAHNPTDVPFTCNNKLIGARDMRVLYEQFIGSETYATARDYDGHGTHTTSTAVGNPDVETSIFEGEFGHISGIAPDAHVVAYSACGNLGCFGGDLALAIDTAVADGVDVINYSIGSSTPGLTGPDDLAFLFAANAGVFVATSAGNTGPGASSIGSPATTPWVTTVGASLQAKTYVAEVITGEGASQNRWSRWLKKDTGRYEGASITPGTGGQLPFVDAASHGNALCDPAIDFTGDIAGKVVLCLRGGPARVEKSQAVADARGAGMVLYNVDDLQDLLTDNHVIPSVNITFSDGMALKQYIAHNGDASTVEITDGEQKRRRGNSMAAFSSRGPVGLPASGDIIKPDVTAPGVQILAGSSLTPTLGSPGELFQSISGTSMSSPHVAGLLALLKQAHPDWTPARAKSALMTTARQDVRKEDGTTRADPFDFGAGHVDPASRASRQGSVFNPGLVYDANIWDYFGFLCATAPEIFVDPAATCALAVSRGGSTIATDLNYPSIAVSEVPGEKPVVRTVTNVSDETDTYRARVDEPAGFDVTVTPDRIRLAPGESATFEVTFVTVDAPLDAWRFGSLSWVDGRNRVRSPIAVKATAIAFPDSVSGTGAEGTISFPVAFGYRGPYLPGAHGLAGNTLITGSVAQDPDQTFVRTDTTGTTAHTIPISGAAHLRITLDVADLTGVQPDTDIDLYLYLGETLVAESTAGGTNEIIDLVAPADGEYTLYVHGWGLLPPTATAGYTLHTWHVPAVAGGDSLSVTGPTEADQGTVADVDATWTGLAPGTYLGAVSHSDGTTPYGYTLVEVTNGG